MDEAERLLRDMIEAKERGYTQRYADARVAILAAMRKGGVPDGWPRGYADEATAIIKALLACPEIADCGADCKDAETETLESRARQFLAAAPQPPALDRDAVIEACAEAMWQAESERAASRPRKVKWKEENEGERERWRGLAAAAIRAMKVRA